MRGKVTFEPIVFKFFKYLNEEKKKYKKEEDLLSSIENLTRMISVPQKYARYILELYKLNYRPDGDYSKLTKDNFIDPRLVGSKKTPNYKSYLYTIAKLPFEGSNLKGYWRNYGTDDEYYVVESYRWYPIYLFKEDIWFKIDHPYSVSTSKQMSQSNPIVYDDEINSKVVLVDGLQMNLLQSGYSVDEIMRSKKESLYQNKKTYISATSNRFKVLVNGSHYTIKYKIVDIVDIGGKQTVVVDVEDVYKSTLTGGKLPTPENYFLGELPGVTPEKIERFLTSNVLIPKFRLHQRLNDDDIVFKFRHLKEEF